MARKSKKVDFVNVNNLPKADAVPAPVSAACYKAGLYARLSEETEENRDGGDADGTSAEVCGGAGGYGRCEGVYGYLLHGHEF